LSYLIKIPECWRGGWKGEGRGGWEGEEEEGGVGGGRWIGGEGADGERETGEALSMHGSRKK